MEICGCTRIMFRRNGLLRLRASLVGICVKSYFPESNLMETLSIMGKKIFTSLQWECCVFSLG